MQAERTIERKYALTKIAVSSTAGGAHMNERERRAADVERIALILVESDGGGWELEDEQGRDEYRRNARALLDAGLVFAERQIDPGLLDLIERLFIAGGTRTLGELESERLAEDTERALQRYARKLPEMPAERQVDPRLTADPVEMQRWGDEMQSEASRLAAAVEHASLPYEAGVALVAVRDLVERWTGLRGARSSPSERQVDPQDPEGFELAVEWFLKFDRADSREDAIRAVRSLLATFTWPLNPSLPTAAQSSPSEPTPEWRCPDCGSGLTKVHMAVGGPFGCGKPPGYWSDPQSAESVEEERNNDNPETVERVARAMAEAPDSEMEWDKLARRALAAARVDPSTEQRPSELTRAEAKAVYDVLRGTDYGDLAASGATRRAYRSGEAKLAVLAAVNPSSPEEES